MGTVIVINSQKGGVSKSFSSNELSAGIKSKTKKRVALLDLAGHAHLTERNFPSQDLPEEIIKFNPAATPNHAHSYNLFFENTEVKPVYLNDGRALFGATNYLEVLTSHPEYVIYDFKERFNNEIRNNFDYIFIDCTPEWGNLMLAAHVVADYVIIPTLLEKSAIDGVEKQLLHIQRIKKSYNPSLKVMGTFVSAAHIINYKKFSLTAVEQLQMDKLIEIMNKYNLSKNDLLKVISYTRSKVNEAILLGKPICEHEPKSIQAKQYRELVDVIIKRTK